MKITTSSARLDEAVPEPAKPAVVIPLTTQHYAMLARNPPYTGATRGKCLVVLVGQRRALAIAVRNQGGRRCWSKLREWLVPGRTMPNATRR